MRRLLFFIMTMASLAVVGQGLETRTLHGQVVADGKPLAGVPVTDGYNIVHTDQHRRGSSMSPRLRAIVRQ